MAKKKYVYDSNEGFAMRVIADHARATAFSIADGIVPGNIGRNYVLRKIMRRAIYHGVKELDLRTPFFFRVTEFVTEMMGGPYPELVASRTAIDRIVKEEEHRFGRILNTGQPKLEEVFDRFAPANPPMAELVKAYDTYGVPRDLIRVVLGQHGVEMDEEQFNEQFDAALTEMQQQAAPVHAVKAKKGSEVYTKLAERFPKTNFTGYQETETTGTRVIAILVDEKEQDSISAGQNGEILLDRTPFYAESGGQVGDPGTIDGEHGLALVEDCYAPVMGYNVHKVEIERGKISIGDTVDCHVDSELRRRTKANHSGTHLLHAALREVLGPHVKQAGSLVAPDRLRFDFTHYAALSEEEIVEIERLVNDQILHNRGVQT
ncbi:MAG: alanine--tRNA ligase-related protein, partial [Blastocatellia bacterium]